MTETTKEPEIKTFENGGTREGPQQYPRDWDWDTEAAASLLEAGVAAAALPDAVKLAVAEHGRSMYLRGLAQAEAALTEQADMMRKRVLVGSATFEGKMKGLRIGAQLLSERVVVLSEKRAASRPLQRAVAKAAAKSGDVPSVAKKDELEKGAPGA